MATPDIKLRRAELRQRKRENRESLALGAVDRAITLVSPIISSPVTMLVGSWLFLDWWAARRRREIDAPGGEGMMATIELTLGMAALKTAITGAFVGNAFGGPTGIAKIIGAAK